MHYSCFAGDCAEMSGFKFLVQTGPQIRIVQQERPAMAMRLIAQPQVSDAAPSDALSQDTPTAQSVSHPFM